MNLLHRIFGRRRAALPAIAPPGSATQVHQVKVWPQYHAAIADGTKSFEVRRADRDYRVGDHLVLNEWDPMLYRYTGPRTICEVTYLLPGGQHGIEPGHVVLGIRTLCTSTAGALL